MLAWSELVVSGAELGLAAGAGCLAVCAPVAGVAMLAGGERGGRGGARSLLSFLLGRFVGYCLFGAAAGALGTTVGWDPASWVAVASSVILAAALIATGFMAGRRSGSFEGPACPSGRGRASWFERRLCPVAGTRLSRLPLILGFLSGLNICPAFIYAGKEALGAGGAAGGLVFFTGFFAGTSVWLLPLALLPMAWIRTGRERISRLARVAAIVVGVVLLMRALVQMRPSTSTGDPMEEVVREMIPDAARVEYLDSPARFRVTRAGRASPDAWVALTAGRGFGGPVPVLTAVDREGRILAVRILECRETPAYLARVDTPEVLGTFTGRSYAEAISLAGVDAVTSATITATAVASAVRSGARAIALEVLLLKDSEGPSGPRIAVTWRDALAILFLCVIAFVFGRGKAPKWRWAGLVTSIASVVVLGLVAGRFLSVADVSRALAGDWPAWPAFAAWYVFFFGILVLTLLRGRIYCRRICPFGALSAIISKTPVPKLRPSRRVQRGLGYVRWLLLVATPAAFALTGSAAVFAFEPFAPLSRMPLWVARGAWAAVALAATAVAASAFVPRLWCRFLCPLGAALEIVARASPLGSGRGADLQDQADDPGPETDESRNVAKGRVEGAADG